MKKLGFTLIELLAVILILGIIALIAIPTVNNIIKESKTGAFKASVQNMASSIEQKCRMQQLKGENITKYYRFEDGTQLTDAGFKGENPADGSIVVDDECNVDVVVNKENYIAIKEKGEDRVTIIEGKYYVPGTPITYNPGDANYTNWYVVKDHGETVTLILNKNLQFPPDVYDSVATNLPDKITSWNSEAKANARLLSINNVLEILGINSWDGNLLYFETKTNIAPSVGQNKYAWLYGDFEYQLSELYLAPSGQDKDNYAYYVQNDGKIEKYAGATYITDRWMIKGSFARPVITVPKTSIQ